MSYTITLLSTDEREQLMEEHLQKVRYEIKSELYGCCIKLMTDDHAIKDTWENNFYSISQNIRSHGRLLVFSNPAYGPDTVLFDPLSRTAFVFNFSYYGWIKSIALSLAGDILEDHHGIFSVHGSCVDIRGNGLCITGAPKAGKTTQTYGLLQDLHTRIVADDWFFSRVYGPDILAYSSEKNFYIGEDLGTIWKQFGSLVPDGEYDHNGRAVADIRWVIGKGRILPMTTLKTIIVLKRDPADSTISRTLDPDTGLKLFVANNYFNPHLLVHNPFKTRIRNRYVAELLERTTVYQVNTTGTPVETQKMIRSLAGIPQGG
ncbi:MAG: aldolase [Methanoregula sp.]|nr:aldolase [Methanoregula sp.]